MKSLLILSCLIAIITLAPLSAYAAEDAAGSSTSSTVHSNMTQKKDTIKKSKEKMKMNHDNMKGQSKDDMKDVPM